MSTGREIHARATQVGPTNWIAQAPNNFHHTTRYEQFPKPQKSRNFFSRFDFFFTPSSNSFALNSEDMSPLGLVKATPDCLSEE